MKFRMTDLSHFVEAASCKTLAEAARRLEITPPTLSESIKRLEQDLACTLFYRSRSGISLTPSGAALLKKAKTTFQTVEQIEALRLGGERFDGRSITVGCHPVVGAYVLPKAFAKLEHAAADFRIELRHGLSRIIQAEIQRGIVDIGIVINPVPSPDLVILKQAFDEVHVWSATGKAKATRIICDPGLIQTQSILRRWKQHPPMIVPTDSLELVARLVHMDLGLGIIPERVVQLVGLPLMKVPRTPVYRDEICIVFRPEFGRARFERILVDALKDGLRS